jgi:putative NIF3 family GTP cyclohydrolase 1 type 2
MDAKKIYDKLDADFDVRNLKDDWSFMAFNEYITPGFRRHYMGLVLDNASEIQKVYTLTMPDYDVLDKIIQTGRCDLLLFSHHAMGYNPNREGFPFYNIPVEYLKKLKERRIAFYVLHAPLDRNGRYSTSVNLARQLNLQITGEFYDYDGIMSGVIGNTDKITVDEFAKQVRDLVGHEIKVIRNGADVIMNGQVGVAAGGGNVDFAVKELAEQGINLYITGCTRKVLGIERIMEFHSVIKEKEINVIGATHYSSEKFACMAMVQYFQKLGLDAEFVEGRYFLEDL